MRCWIVQEKWSGEGGGLQIQNNEARSSGGECASARIWGNFALPEAVCVRDLSLLFGVFGSVVNRAMPRGTSTSLFLPDLLVQVIFIVPLTGEIVCKKYIRKNAVGTALLYYVEC